MPKTSFPYNTFFRNKIIRPQFPSYLKIFQNTPLPQTLIPPFQLRFKDHFQQDKERYGASQDDGAEIQSALTKLTAQPTLPNVFIGGKHIGGSGGSANQGKLLPLLTQAGATVNSSASTAQ
ncbi:Glutaredoxin-C2 [Sesamum angolense]|uniref:Glutaredoxin-C2 n=1 Tax=Sesamum angolense TaxID=2727404 RepID=A0AAE1WH01_9LAMI|nr:Glutaredoxin-C2 [Sesamum angolense]